jgi:hypothetical protein
MHERKLLDAKCNIAHINTKHTLNYDKGYSTFQLCGVRKYS